jgi:superfamily II DNA or RNA helicase
MRLVRRDPNLGYLDSSLWVPKNQVNVSGLKNALSPSIARGNQVDFLFLWKETEHHLLVPREFWDPGQATFEIVDCRPTTYERVDIRSKIRLDCIEPDETTQTDALAAMLAARGGILQLACGKGKSIIALELAARRSVPTLIVVDNTVLLKQWQEEIELHLDVPDGVGLIRGDKDDWHKPVVLATYQTLSNRADTMEEEIRRWFGLVIWDEAHHVPAPTFCKTADLFYGGRYGLTATPTRDDGLHIASTLHIGKVLYKNLKQSLRPRIYFKWTGFKIDGDDPVTAAAVNDKNRELHFGKLAGYFGQWQERLDFIINEVNEASAEGRKIMVLSNSLDETINLLALWNGAELYTNIPVPTPQDVGETAPALELAKQDFKKVSGTLQITIGRLADPALNPVKRAALEQHKQELEYRLIQHYVHTKVAKELRRRQRAYMEKILTMPSDAGIIIQKVKADLRDQMIRTKQIVFAISKYGKEGLNSPLLDTVILCEPMSKRNTLQQVMGRILRKRANKKSPVLLFLEDDVGPLIGMCKKLKRHLRDWPIEDGGPYEYEILNHPSSHRKAKPTWNTRTFSSP